MVSSLSDQYRRLFSGTLGLLPIVFLNRALGGTLVHFWRECPGSSRFQPGEGPSRGLLRNYKPSDGDGPSFQALIFIFHPHILLLVRLPDPGPSCDCLHWNYIQYSLHSLSIAPALSYVNSVQP